MFKFIVSLLIVLSFNGSVFAKKKLSRERVLEIYKRNIEYAYDNGFDYSTIAWLKEFIYLSNGNTGAATKYLNRAVLKVGAKNFQGLNTNVLKRGQGSVFRYILAKKLFSQGKFQEAKSELGRISGNSAFYPFAQNYLGVINYLEKKYTRSLEYFQTCIGISENRMGDRKKGDYIYKQYKVNRDICTAGKARVFYAQRKLDKADFLYLDLDKSSIVWPTILIEEAWSSYYTKNYNRTLGKLVTYNAPLLKYVTNPEIHVLRAMTYLKMCLYPDVGQVVENFYKNYEGLAQRLESLLSKYTKAKIHYYNLVDSYKSISNKEFMYAIKGIYKSPNIRAFIDNVKNAEIEREKIMKVKSGVIKRSLLSNINEFIVSQKKVVGISAKAKLQKHAYDLRKAFQAMSYMKLEVLGRKKESLYFDRKLTGKRGDVRYLATNDKQYFWDFNSEFWSDELGDYVFTLPTECPNDN